MVELRQESDLGVFLSCPIGARKNMAGERRGQPWDSLPEPGGTTASGDSRCSSICVLQMGKLPGNLVSQRKAWH